MQTWRRMRILLIDGDTELARFVQRGLAAEGHSVDMASDGRTGWKVATTCQYDLIVLDLVLSGMDGCEVLRRLRHANKSVPVLILSARRSVQDKVSTIEAGADDYLTKPFAFPELLVRVQALMRRGPVNRASTISVSDLELDRISQRVRRGGQCIELSSKEYALLEYLMSNAGRVISRKTIIEHIWDKSFDCVANVVDVYVSQLRSKIDSGFEAKLLRTVRGVGYIMLKEQ